MIAGVWAPMALWAQVPAPDEAGVAMGHFHVYARDLASAKQLWVNNIGGTPLKVDGIDVVKFPGVLVFLEQGSQSVKGTEGTAINHIGFFVLDGKDFLVKWKAAGFKEDLNDPKIGDHGYIYTLEGLKIEIQENHILKDEGKAQTLPIVTDHIHFNGPAAYEKEAQAWYLQRFWRHGCDAKRRRYSRHAAAVGGVENSYSAVADEGPDAGPCGFRGQELGGVLQEDGSRRSEV